MFNQRRRVMNKTSRLNFTTFGVTDTESGNCQVYTCNWPETFHIGSRYSCVNIARSGSFISASNTRNDITAQYDAVRKRDCFTTVVRKIYPRDPIYIASCKESSCNRAQNKMLVYIYIFFFHEYMYIKSIEYHIFLEEF